MLGQNPHPNSHAVEVYPTQKQYDYLMNYLKYRFLTLRK